MQELFRLFCGPAAFFGISDKFSVKTLRESLKTANGKLTGNTFSDIFTVDFCGGAVRTRNSIFGKSVLGTGQSKDRFGDGERRAANSKGAGVRHRKVRGYHEYRIDC